MYRLHTFKSIGALLLLSGFCQFMKAQLIEPCGFDHYAHQLYMSYPEMIEAKENILSRDNQPILKRSNEVYTISLIIHQVYKDSFEILPDSFINRVIDNVNADFRFQNQDSSQIRSLFRDRVGDTGIQFRIDSIIRVKTDTLFKFDLFSGLPDYVKYSASGGSDAIDTERHLNIWVCTIEGNALFGYAYPPEGLGHWPGGSSAPEPGVDGVVIHKEAFHYDNVLQASGMLVRFNGRTVTHEIGHYLGLRHIWGDGLSILGIPACDEDDGVEDTPNQGFQSNFNCDTTLNTCTDATDDEPDMIENHMDYSSEICKTAFTIGQATIMRSVLENERYLLIDEGSATHDVKPTNRDNLIQVSPNPFESNVRITYNQDILFNDARICVRDLLGMPILNQEGAITSLDLSHLPAGVYLVEVLLDNYREVKRIVKH